jgi:hypothetical protein
MKIGQDIIKIFISILWEETYNSMIYTANVCTDSMKYIWGSGSDITAYAFFL